MWQPSSSKVSRKGAKRKYVNQLFAAVILQYYDVIRFAAVPAPLVDLPMHPHDRHRFDEQVDKVLAQMPPQVHELLEQVPMHVEDYPSDEIMHDRRVRHRDDLCGLYTGVPLTQRSIWHSGTLPDVITIYREGIVRAAADHHGRVRDDSLREQIRITILHELGHHHGMTEDDLRELGYG